VRGPASDNIKVAAYAPAARSGEHGAYGARELSRIVSKSGGTWPTSSRAGAASATPKRYVKSSGGCR
jgi:hypothetical protein